MDIVKDIKGNIVNVGDTIKFRNCDFETMEKSKYIIIKISEIDYKTKIVHLENNYCCKYTTSSQWEIENGMDNKDYVIGGEKLNINV